MNYSLQLGSRSLVHGRWLSVELLMAVCGNLAGHKVLILFVATVS